jgi:hypothetical protein
MRAWFDPSAGGKVSPSKAETHAVEARKAEMRILASLGMRGFLRSTVSMIALGAAI